MVLPVLTYGAEIWGHTLHKDIENVQVKYFKRFLGAKRSAPGAGILGDCGRHLIFTNTIMKCVKFWIKLIRLPTNRYTRKCYDMLVELDKRGNITWATKIRQLLQTNGFGYAWFYQGVANESNFLRIFKERIKDIDAQNWSSRVKSYDKLRMYISFKSNFCVEPYILYNHDSKRRSFMANFRFSSLELNIEMGRRKKVPIEDRICCLCSNYYVENEYHLLAICSSYNDLRRRYLPDLAHNASFYQFTLHMQKRRYIDNVMNFIYYAMKRRDELMKGNLI